MSIGTAALAILEMPFRSMEGQKAPAQFAQVVDPDGVLRDLSRWLSAMAESIEAGGPEEIVGQAASTLRRAAGRYSALLPA